MTEKLVTQQIFESGDIRFFAYTATSRPDGTSWCGPCNRIKPYIEKYMKNYQLISTRSMPLLEYKTTVNDLVPFFIVFDTHNKELAKIQTSSSVSLHEFINKNGIYVEPDEDF